MNTTISQVNILFPDGVIVSSQSQESLAWHKISSVICIFTHSVPNVKATKRSKQCNTVSSKKSGICVYVALLLLLPKRDDVTCFCRHVLCCNIIFTHLLAHIVAYRRFSLTTFGKFPHTADSTQMSTFPN